jgi:hypothetical protein
MRKDSECFFGSLKGRFRSLKIGRRLRGPESCDRLFKTCVALRDHSLHCGGLDKIWINGVHLPLSARGDHDPEDLESTQSASSEHVQNWRGGGFPSAFGRTLDDIRPTSVEEHRHVNSQCDTSATIISPDPAGDDESDDEVHPTFSNRVQDKLTVAPIGPVGGAVHQCHGHTFRETLATHWDVAWRGGRNAMARTGQKTNSSICPPFVWTVHAHLCAVCVPVSFVRCT